MTSTGSCSKLEGYSDVRSHKHSSLANLASTLFLNDKAGLIEDDDTEIAELLHTVPEVRNNFEVIEKVGSGTFSSVFVARLKDCDEDEKFALKCIVPTSLPLRIVRELQCLTEIGGQDNVMGIEACIREKDRVVMVMPYFEHDKFQDYIECLSAHQVKQYMWNLLVALCRIHKFNYIHRDVKPSNFLVNQKLGKYALIDFGLAQKVLTCQTQKSQLMEKQKLAMRQAMNRKVMTRKRRKVGIPVNSSLRTDTPIVERNVVAADGVGNIMKQCPVLGESNTPSSTIDSLHKKRQLSPNTNMTAEKKAKRIYSRNDAILQAARLKNKQDRLATVMDCTRNLKKENLLPSPNDKEENANESINNKEINNIISVTTLLPSVVLQPYKVQTASTQHNRNKIMQAAKSRLEKPMKKKCISDAIVDNKPITDEQGKKDNCNVTLRTVQPMKRKSNVIWSKDGRYLYHPKTSRDSCPCLEKPQVCVTCLSRPIQEASRAGTPGFRPPEVLMKCPQQTTAVDMWAAGVIFLSLLSRRYPFFKASDDLSALAQIVSLFGTKAVNEAAASYGKTVSSSPYLPPLDLRQVCSSFQRNYCNEDDVSQPVTDFEDSAYDLLLRLLDLNSKSRITAAEALQHPYFQQTPNSRSSH